MSKSAHELTRKEMKGPDKFQVAAAEAAEWAARRQKQLLGVAVGLLVLVAIVIGISSYLESRRARAGAALSAALETAGGEVTPIPLPNMGRPTFVSAEDKARAVLDAASRVRERGGRPATTAALLAGDAHLALKEWDKAAEAYQSFLSGAPADDSLRFGGFDGLARAQEGKGDLEAAAKSWEKAGEIAFFKDRATLERARVLAKAGKADDARKALEGIAKESPVQAEAQERLARLGK
jgi:tetratricopeptide (TPR) repeat protein